MGLGRQGHAGGAHNGLAICAGAKDAPAALCQTWRSR